MGLDVTPYTVLCDIGVFYSFLYLLIAIEIPTPIDIPIKIEIPTCQTLAKSGVITTPSPCNIGINGFPTKLVKYAGKSMIFSNKAPEYHHKISEWRMLSSEKIEDSNPHTPVIKLTTNVFLFIVKRCQFHITSV